MTPAPGYIVAGATLALAGAIVLVAGLLAAGHAAWWAVVAAGLGFGGVSAFLARWLLVALRREVLWP